MPCKKGSSLACSAAQRRLTSRRHAPTNRAAGSDFMSAGTNENLAKTIDLAFEQRDTIRPTTQGGVREAVEQALDLLDRGEARVAEKAADGSWHVNQWLKKAVLLSFRLNDMSEI